MSSTPESQSTPVEASSTTFWLVRWHRTIFFAALIVTTIGIYAFYKTPIAVFPETNFPRVVIGVDNGVMPVEQMQVTITKPIEDAVNSVPGLQTVRSTTSRGTAEVSLFFDWSADMFRTLELVNAALSRVQQSLPSTVKITTNRLTFATFPILGYSLTSNTLSQTQLWELATYTLQPPLNRVDGVSTVTVQGGKIPEFHVVPNMAKLQASGITILDLSNAIGAANIIDSPGLYEENHQLVLALVGSQAHGLDDLKQLAVKSTTSGVPVRVSDVADVIQAPNARLYVCLGERKTRCTVEHHTSALTATQLLSQTESLPKCRNCARNFQRASALNPITTSRSLYAKASRACEMRC